MVWVMVEDGQERHDNGPNGRSKDQEGHNDDTGRIRQVVWNERVAELGATGVGVGAVYPESGNEVQQEVRLMWEGALWMPEVAVPTMEEERT